MSKLAITRDSNYRNYPLLDYDGPGRGFYTAILDRLIDRLEYQLAAHDKVLMIRLVAKYPDEVDAEKSNQCFQYFMEEYRRKLELITLLQLIHHVVLLIFVYSIDGVNILLME